jgi:hypothetical protein
MGSNLIACSENVLGRIRPMAGPVSCWIHFEDRWSRDLGVVITELLRIGCFHFAVSGNRAEFLHDEIDDAIGDQSRLILTTWHAGSFADAAEAYLAVQATDGSEPTRLLTAFTNNAEKECATLSEMLSALNVASYHPIPVPTPTG